MKKFGNASANTVAAPAKVNFKLRWDSPKLHEIEQTWQHTPVPPNTPRRSQADKALLQLAEILRASLSEKECRELVDSFDTMPAHKRHGSNFLYSLPEAMVIVLLQSKDRESLVTLLSKRFPPKIGLFTDVESELVSEEYKLKDAILILGEAYSKCKVPVMRAKIAETVRHAFTGNGVRGKDDDEFVKNAMRWYEQNKGNLVVNYGYAINVVERYHEDIPLFEEKRTPPPDTKTQH